MALKTTIWSQIETPSQTNPLRYNEWSGFFLREGTKKTIRFRLDQYNQPFDSDHLVLEPIKHGVFITMVSPLESTYEMRTKQTGVSFTSDSNNQGLNPNIICLEIYRNNKKILEVGMDGNVCLYNTTIDDAARAFWYALGESSPFIYELARLREQFFKWKDKIEHIDQLEEKNKDYSEQVKRTLGQLKTVQEDRDKIQRELAEAYANSNYKIHREQQIEIDTQKEAIIGLNKEVNRLESDLDYVRKQNEGFVFRIDRLNTSLNLAKQIISKLAPFIREVMSSGMNRLIDQFEGSIK